MVDLKVAILGGDKMDAMLSRIADGARRATSVDVGFMSGATEADGTPVPLVAALNEYGVPSRGQPARPFMRNAIAERNEAWVENMGIAMSRTNYDSEAALRLVGIDIKKDIEASILKLTQPPLAASTIRRKGFAKPLIETSTMLGSVTYKVNKGE